MRLVGRDFDPAALVAKVRDRLGASAVEAEGEEATGGPEPAPDPERFFLNALDRHADCRAGLPIETHRTGLGRAVLYAKTAFRKGGQPFINEVLERQRVFNGYVRDSIALLVAEVRALRDEVASLRAERGGQSPRA